MVQKVEVIYVDDLDGSEAFLTTKFSIGGENYEIELSPSNREAFLAALEPYRLHGRRVFAQPSKPQSTHRRRNARGLDRSTQRTPASQTAQQAHSESETVNTPVSEVSEPKVTIVPASNATVLAWARAHGYTVKPGARPSAAVRQAFEQANTRRIKL